MHYCGREHAEKFQMAAIICAALWRAALMLSYTNDN
jgi:hypothetical protein